MALIHYLSSWVDGVRPNKATIRAGFRDFVPHAYASVAEFRTIETQSAKNILINGVVYVLDAADTTTADDGINCVHSLESLRYKRRLEGRELLTAARTYFVRPDGNNANNGLSNTAGGAFLTLQRAADVVGGLDTGVHNVTIDVADGTYAAVLLRQHAGAGTVTWRGNKTTPANVVIDGSGPSIGVQALGVRGQVMQGFTTANGTYQIFLDGASNVTFNHWRFTGTPIHVYATGNSLIRFGGTISVTGGGLMHTWLEAGARGLYVGATIVVTSGIAFSQKFTFANNTASINYNSITITNAAGATGARYEAALNGTILVWGLGANYLPGDTAGSVNTGGQYSG